MNEHKLDSNNSNSIKIKNNESNSNDKNRLVLLKQNLIDDKNELEKGISSLLSRATKLNAEQATKVKFKSQINANGTISDSRNRLKAVENKNILIPNASPSTLVESYHDKLESINLIKVKREKLRPPMLSIQSKPAFPFVKGNQSDLDLQHSKYLIRQETEQSAQAQFPVVKPPNVVTTPISYLHQNISENLIDNTKKKDSFKNEVYVNQSSLRVTRLLTPLEPRVDNKVDEMEVKHRMEIKEIDFKIEKIKKQQELENFEIQVIKQRKENEHEQWLLEQKHKLEILRVKKVLFDEQSKQSKHSSLDINETPLDKLKSKANEEIDHIDNNRSSKSNNFADNDADINNTAFVFVDGLILRNSLYQGKYYRLVVGLYNQDGQLIPKLSGTDWQLWKSVTADDLTLNYINNPFVKKIASDTMETNVRLKCLIEIQYKNHNDVDISSLGWTIFYVATASEKGEMVLKDGTWRVPILLGETDPFYNPDKGMNIASENGFILLRITDFYNSSSEFDKFPSTDMTEVDEVYKVYDNI